MALRALGYRVEARPDYQGDTQSILRLANGTLRRCGRPPRWRGCFERPRDAASRALMDYFGGQGLER